MPLECFSTTRSQVKCNIRPTFKMSRYFLCLVGLLVRLWVKNTKRLAVNSDLFCLSHPTARSILVQP